MFDKVWKLKYDGSVVGLRVKKGNVPYDVDIEPFRGRPLDIDILPALVMKDYGDLIMTEQEFESKETIAELPFSEELVVGVKDYIKQYRMNDYRLRNAYIQRTKKIRQEYYTYLPDAWLKDFAEYHEDNFGGNRNIYTVFNDEQRKLIVDYFRWRSKILFDEAKQNRVLRKSMKKAQQLANIMGDADDWYYDGTVDTGYMGGGHCTLGHALRYQHFAMSRSTKREVIFGATCMADFFDLDKTLLDNIAKAQDKMIKEVKVIAYLLDSDKVVKYKADYDALWDIMKHFKGRFKDTIPNGNGWASFMGNFDAKGLPLTRPMLDVYYKLRSIYNRETNQQVGKAVDAVVKPNSLEYYKLGLDNHAVEYDPHTLKTLFSGRMRSSLSTVVLNCEPKVKEDFVFVGKALKLLNTLERITSDLSSKEGGSMSLGYIVILRDLVNTEFPIYDNFKERRLATVQEEASNDPNVVKEYFFTERRKRAVNLLFRYTIETAPMLRSPELRAYISEFKDNYSALDDLVRIQYREWIESSINSLSLSYHKRMLSERDAKKGNQGVSSSKPSPSANISQPKSETPPPRTTVGRNTRPSGGQTRITPYQTEGKFGNGLLVAEMYDHIKSNRDLMTPAEARQFDRIPTHDLENAHQGLFIFNVYERTLKRAKEKELESIEPRLTSVSVYNSYVEELFNLIENSHLDRKEFVFVIIDTIRANKTISDKQKKHIRSALAKVM